MSWHYAYTPYIWPVLAAAVFPAVMAMYAWRHRHVRGALPFAVMWWLDVPWVASNALVLAAVDLPAKIFWLQFHFCWGLPQLTAGLCFVLVYANLESWLNRRTLSLLAIPPLSFVLLAVTNNAHHLLWLGFSFERYLLPRDGIAGRVFFAYGLSLAVAILLVFLWLFVQSPPHRRPVAMLFGAFVLACAAGVLAHYGVNPIAPLDPGVVASPLTASLYALALFRFHIFDLVPIARGTAIEQMSEGMLVLDPLERIVDLNSAAERILGAAAARVRGASLTELLPGCGRAEAEIALGKGAAVRHYALHRSALKDRRGSPLGYLLLLHDVTAQKQAQAQLLEQQRALATLRERDRAAREMHDGVAQALAYLKVQAEAAQSYLAQDQPSEVNHRLARLVEAAQDAHADVREYILGARAGISAGAAFLPALEHYVRQFSGNYGITAKLSVSPEFPREALDPMVEAQLLRIIQEALTNVRKHARARVVNVGLAARDGHAEASVEDDGAGFDPASLDAAGGTSFGLRFMRDRAEEVRGSIRIQSAPAGGTRVVINVPLRKEQS